MNKRIISIILVFVLLYLTVTYAAKKAWAFSDPFSFYTIGGIAYAMATDWGISFTTAAATSQGLSNWMSGQLGDYCDYKQQTITEVFGSEAARMVSGKLVVGQEMVNGIMGFVDWLTDKFEPEQNLSSSFDGSVIPYYGGPAPSVTGEGIEVIFSGQGVGNTAYDATGYYNGQNRFYRSRQSGSGGILKEYRVYLNLLDGNIYVDIYQVNRDEELIKIEPYKMVTDPSLEDVLNWDSTDYSRPTVLNPDQEWSGTIGGQDWPDTNLDDMIDTIYDDMGLNDLEVEGEIIDVPIPPEPTPAPIDPDIPLQDVPWEGLNDLVDQTGKDITDSIDDAAKDVVDALDDIKDQTAEGFQDITQVLEGVGDDVKDLTDTIEEALTAPEIDEKTFDLRELFPFCIPFDIYHLLQKFDATPAAPHFQLPIVIQSIGFSYMLDLDFSAWNPVAATLRTVELIVYAIGLAWATSKVIKW